MLLLNQWLFFILYAFIPVNIPTASSTIQEVSIIVVEAVAKSMYAKGKEDRGVSVLNMRDFLPNVHYIPHQHSLMYRYVGKYM